MIINRTAIHNKILAQSWNIHAFTSWWLFCRFKHFFPTLNQEEPEKSFLLLYYYYCKLLIILVQQISTKIQCRCEKFGFELLVLLGLCRNLYKAVIYFCECPISIVHILMRSLCELLSGWLSPKIIQYLPWWYCILYGFKWFKIFTGSRIMWKLCLTCNEANSWGGLKPS